MIDWIERFRWPGTVRTVVDAVRLEGRKGFKIWTDYNERKPRLEFTRYPTKEDIEELRR